MIKKKITSIALLTATLLMSCNDNVQNVEVQKEEKTVQLITLDPGHFHAALVQKTMYPDVDSTVHVYAPDGSDLKLHLDRIKDYNTRSENPTHWKEEVYTGNDFFEKMLAQKNGNVVVLAGNNQKKTDYILTALQNGFNVLGDKPMAIDSKGFEQLKQAFDAASKNNLLLYDIMTERFEITSILQRELSMIPEIFGTLEKGTPGAPAIVKESVHYFYKYVSGNVLTRPGWFLDETQQGDGIADVMTHVVDLVQWESFPEQIIDYNKDIQVNSARHWTTNMTLSQFKDITKLDSFPAYLKNKVKDTTLEIYSNGEIDYQIRGVHVKTSVVWNYKAPEGTGDSYYSLMKGTNCNLIIKQGEVEKYKPVLYIEPLVNGAAYESVLMQKIKIIQTKYPGVELKQNSMGFEVIIPEKYREGHEEHFARVTKNFLDYLKNKSMPAWEVPGMIAKYYTTTKALELATQKQ
ncbi:MAG: putative oxidoreductase C-terminal domain-containing protein [Ginsengibacter sp.]